MEQDYSGAVIIDSSEEEIAKLTEKWQKIEKTGKKLSKIGNSGFIITLLSPFDFEGPVAEVTTAVVAAVGFVMKTVAKERLNDLSNSEDKIFTEEDNEEFKNIVDNFAGIRR